MSIDLHTNKAREAVESLGGYAYQLYQSAIAWALLKHDQTLILEVAEDYAVCAKQAVEAVQVKRTKTTITSNTESICQAVDSLLQLASDNPKKIITLRYLTTSEIGVERNKSDRINGVAVLSYWNEVRDSGDIEALRTRLLNMSINKASKSFVRTASNEQLREHLIKRVHFDSGASDFAQLQQTLRDVLVAEGDRKNLFAKESEQAASKIVERILLVSSSTGRRELTRPEFLRLFEAENTAQIPVTMLRDITASGLATMAGGQHTQLITGSGVLEPLTKLTAPSPYARREELRELFKRSLARNIVWLHGGSGFGKTLLARAGLEEYNGLAAMVRLRDKTADQMEALLAAASVELLSGAFSGLLIDDIDHLESQAVQSGLNRLIAVLDKKQKPIVICSYRKPSPALLSHVGIPVQACIEVGRLTEQDFVDLTQSAPNNHQAWQTYVRLGSSNGHPQLAHALAVGLQERNWPTKDLQKMAAPLGQDEAINLTKDEARRRILAELPEGQRLLLYRLSLFSSVFTRGDANALSDITPTVSAPGEKLDKLVGPWIDQIASNHYQISPLVVGLGAAQLGAEDQKTTHAKIASTLVASGSIDASRIDQIALSAILGEADSALVMLCMAILSTEVEQLETLASQAVSFKFWRTDRPSYPSNLKLSIQLRMVQTLLLLADSKNDEFLAAFNAFQSELNDMNDAEASSVLRMTLYGKLLLVPQLAEAYPDFPALISVAASAAEEHGVTTEYEFQEHTGYPETKMSMASALFTLQLGNLQTLSALESVLRSLNELSVEERTKIEPQIDSIRYNPEQIVKSIWLKAKKNDGYESIEFVKQALSFADIFEEIGARPFAVGCFITVAVIQAEEIKEFEEAYKTLDLAEGKFGGLYEIRRGRAGVLFNENRHQEQIDAIEPYLDEMLENSWIERTYLFRELAISHGSLDNWVEAYEYFEKARDSSERVEASAIRLMSVGLLADAAICLWNAGDKVLALTKIKNALLQLKAVDANESFNANALHRLVRFSGWWIYAVHNRLKETNSEIKADMVVGCNSNPNPHSTLTGPPIGAINMIFYLLAEVDIAHGSAAGIWTDIVSKFSEEESIISQEYLLYHQVFSDALKRRDGKTLAQFGPLTVDAMAAFPRIPKKNLSPENPLPGKPARLEGVPWEEGRLGLIDQLVSFMFDAIVSGQPDEIEEFTDSVEKSDRPLLTPEELVALSKGDMQVASPSISMLAAIREFRTALITGQRPVVPSLFLVSLRIFEACQKAPSNYQARPTLVQWAFEAWLDTIRQERFRFSTPDLAERDIYPLLNPKEKNVASLAKLLLAIKPYLGVGVGASFIDALKRGASE